MADYQRVVDEIRSFLQSSDQTYSDTLKELAASYAQACQEVNQRLRRCEDFLRKGLFSEAIHFAETEPILMDLVAILDFPERSQWDEVSLMYSLPPPLQLLLPTAEALNEAYVAARPLDHLMRQHRHLALARAPLGERLAIMRQVAAIDSSNHVWNEDIEKFEKTRFRQIETSLDSAIHQDDTATVATLHDELTKTSWIVAPSAALAAKAEKSAGRAVRKKTRESLQKLETELHDSVAARDWGQARKLRARWKAETARHDLPLEDLLWERVSAALELIDAQDRIQAEDRKYQAVVEELEKALSESTSREHLESLYNQAQSFGRGFSKELQDRCQIRLQTLRTALKKKRRRIIIASLAGAFASFTLIAIAFHKIDQSNRLKTATDSLNKMLESDQIAEARAYLIELAVKDEHVAKSPAVVQLESNLTAAEKREKERKALFQQSLQEAEPRPTRVDDGLALEQAKKLARLPSETAALDELIGRRTRQSQHKQEFLDTAYEARVKSVSEKLREIQKMLSTSFDPASATARIEALQSDVSVLLAESKGVSAGAAAMSKTFPGQIEALRETVARNNLESQDEQELTESLRQAPKLQAFAKALEKYRGHFPDSPRGKDFDSTLLEIPHAQGVLEWGQLLWEVPENPLPSDFSKAAALVSKGSRFLKSSPDFVDSSTAHSYLTHIEAIVQRNPDLSDSAAAQLQNLFSNLVVKSLWTVKLKGDLTYYVTDREVMSKWKTPSDEYFNFQYLAAADGTLKGRRVRREIVQEVVRAPQSKLADLFAEHNRSKRETWEEKIIAILRKIQDDTVIDPVLKLILLKRLLNIAERGSYPLSLALAPVVQKLHLANKEANLNLTVSWFDPSDREARTVRLEARKVLNQIPSLATALKEAAAQQDRLKTEFANSHREVVGWLMRGPNQNWHCRSPVDWPGNHELFALDVGPGKKSSWSSVGQIVGGTINIDSRFINVLREGRLVFVVKPRPEPK